MGSIKLWSQLNRNVELYIHTLDLYTGNYIPEELVGYKEGTFIQVNKEEPSLYLDQDGDGFIFFSPDDLDEIYIDPSCFFCNKDELPQSIREKENYPDWFDGNPEEWFDKNILKVFQG